MAASKRIFIAVPCSQKMRDSVTDWQQKQARLPVRWLEGKNLHITILPPWYETEMEKVKEKISRAAEQFIPFSVPLTEISFGPDPKRPRLIWITGHESKDLLSLGEKTAAAFEIFGGRPILTHLTLARFRIEDFKLLPRTHFPQKIDWKEKVDSLVLMESRLSPHGADYEILCKFDFGKNQ